MRSGPRSGSAPNPPTGISSPSKPKSPSKKEHTGTAPRTGQNGEKRQTAASPINRVPRVSAFPVSASDVPVSPELMEWFRLMDRMAERYKTVRREKAAKDRTMQASVDSLTSYLDTRAAVQCLGGEIEKMPEATCRLSLLFADHTNIPDLGGSEVTMRAVRQNTITNEPQGCATNRQGNESRRRWHCRVLQVATGKRDAPSSSD